MKFSFRRKKTKPKKTTTLNSIDAPLLTPEKSSGEATFYRIQSPGRKGAQTHSTY